MTTNRNILAEIEEIRGRATGITDVDSGIGKLLFLSTLVRRVTDKGEQQRYFIVASIAALETYFRWRIRTLIDSEDSKYVNNIRNDSLAPKLDHEIAIALHGRNLTIGELVAHSVRLSSFEKISKAMSDLLGTPFVELVKGARYDPRSRRPGDAAQPILSDPGRVIANVKRAFTLRHIICHEAYIHSSIELEEIKAVCVACYDFVQASHYGIHFLQNPNAPITLEGRLEVASVEEASLWKEVNTVADQFAARLSDRERFAFKAMQESWRAYADMEAAFFAAGAMSGHRGVYDAINARIRLYRERIKELQRWEQTMTRANKSS